MKNFKLTLPFIRLLPRVRLPRLWKLPEVELPQVNLRVRVDFPEEIVPGGQMEVERVEFALFDPKSVKVIFRRIPAESGTPRE